MALPVVRITKRKPTPIHEPTTVNTERCENKQARSPVEQHHREMGRQPLQEQHMLCGHLNKSTCLLQVFQYAPYQITSDYKAYSGAKCRLPLGMLLSASS